MNRHITAILAFLLTLLLSACSSEAVKGSVYEALQQKGCIDRSGTPHCDPEHKGYEEYKKERDAALKPNP